MPESFGFLRRRRHSPGNNGRNSIRMPLRLGAVGDVGKIRHAVGDADVTVDTGALAARQRSGVGLDGALSLIHI